MNIHRQKARRAIGRATAALVLFFSSLETFAQNLNVPLTVKETAGVGSANFPVSAVVPLPRGRYQSVTQLRVVDSSGVVVPAQVEILNRHWGTDQSLRHVMVHFQPKVDAFTSAGTGVSRYYLRDNGYTVNGKSPIFITANTTGYTIKSGAYQFVITTAPFSIKTPAGSVEAIFTGQNATDIQRSFERKDVSVVLEEKGPIRTVVRAEAPTLYGPLHQHGWALRLYFYAGLPYMKMDFQLQNSAKNVVYSAPLYFQDLSIKIATNRTATPQEIRADQVNGDFSALPAPVASAANASVLMRNFYETWPNQVAVTSTGELSASLFPAWGAQWYKGALNPAGLYWLDDMQHVYKEILFVFGTPNPAELTKLAKTFQYRPVVTLPTDWYAQTAVTLDMEGLIPVDSRVVTTDERRPVYSASQLNLASTNYNFGWMNFLLDIVRKHDVAAPGGWAYSVARFIATENPRDYFQAENFASGELNGRPQWLTKFNYDKDNALLRLTANPYGGDSWRKFVNAETPKLAKPYASGTWRNAYPRDDQHGWFYHIEEAYELTGNYWIRDWYNFVGEFRKVRLNEKDPWPDRSSRATGHALNHALQAYRVTGRTELLRLFHDYVIKFLKPQLDPLTGGKKGVDAPFQVGYLARALIDYLDEVGSDPEVLEVVKGLVNWNVKHAQFSYYYPPVTASSGTGLTMVDVQAWYALKFKDKEAYDQLKLFLSKGIRGGAPSYGDVSKWSGDFVGRWTHYLLAHPELAP